MRPLKPGERRYAVAVRDGADLFLFLDIRRGPGGDVYVNHLTTGWLRGWNPHTSKHKSGEGHERGFKDTFGVRRGQKIDASFRGVENVIVRGIARDEPRGLGIPCVPSDFVGVMEIPIDKLRPERYRTSLSVDITEGKPMPISTPGTQPQQKVFDDDVPWIVVTLYETD